MFYSFALPFKRRQPPQHLAKRDLLPKDPQKLAEDPRYLAVQHQIQQGAWAPALQLLTVLQADYPQNQTITRWLKEATLRQGLDDTWQGKIKERAHSRTYRRWIGLAALLLLITICTIASLFFWNQAQPLKRSGPADQAMLVDAQTALQEKQYRRAVEVYRQVLATAPAAQIATEANKGLEEAILQLKLANHYEAGVRALQQQQFTTAATILTDLKQKAPNYRDTERLLRQIQQAQAAAELFTQAEAAYQAQEWTTAIAHYEALRQIDPNLHAALVIQHLATAYGQSSPTSTTAD